jgi:L-fuconolactonase
MTVQLPPLLDAHHHLWQHGGVPRRGILGESYLDGEFLWPDLERAAEGLPLEATCLVQAREDEQEVPYAEAVAAHHPRLRAMIAWAPLEQPHVDTVLARLGEHPIVRGVRRSTQHEADPAFVARPAFVAGARRLADLGLLLEVCVKHEQLAAVADLAQACPDTSIVVQHLGKPDVSGPPPAHWLETMRALGRYPSVSCKVSPVVHTAGDPVFTLERQAPFVRHAVDCFGWDRVLFGSNWPVANAVVSYRGWVEMLAHILQDVAQPGQLEAFFAGTARRLYRVERIADSQ